MIHYMNDTYHGMTATWSFNAVTLVRIPVGMVDHKDVEQMSYAVSNDDVFRLEFAPITTQASMTMPDRDVVTLVLRFPEGAPISFDLISAKYAYARTRLDCDVEDFNRLCKVVELTMPQQKAA